MLLVLLLALQAHPQHLFRTVVSANPLTINTASTMSFTL
jgi:hypothetical protein